MKMALNAKNKFGFVDGSVTKPASDLVEIQAWERCNDMVLSWILNSIDKSLTSSIIYASTPCEVWIDLEERFSQSNNPRIFQLKRDITTVRQEQNSLASYYNTLKSYRDELGTYITIPNCTCGIIPKCTCGIFTKLQEIHETECVYQFLMGLNDTYAPIRSQILVMEPLPNVSKIFAIINQEEKQRLLHLPSR
ncbi:Copia-like polyprotein/retrotransposon [Thalictrum thalictroides]|uniref:Copia-like polyprotein/retrotransposon n=1 Tax=Thalictrum thalictroides TaxID=46969 RepID=A0A7J6WAL3_THATH|nr:Copia-like polyprotein/retrotransposon [Thalictrum thalictroides]